MSGRSATPENQGDHKEKQENQEQNFSYSGCRACDPGEAEHGGNYSYDEKSYCQPYHCLTSLLLAFVM
jgi:hypothetical protein